MGAMRPGMGHPEAGDLRNQRFGSAMGFSHKNM